MWNDLARTPLFNSELNRKSSIDCTKNRKPGNEAKTVPASSARRTLTCLHAWYAVASLPGRIRARERGYYTYAMLRKRVHHSPRLNGRSKFSDCQSFFTL